MTGNISQNTHVALPVGETFVNHAAELGASLLRQCHTEPLVG